MHYAVVKNYVQIVQIKIKALIKLTVPRIAMQTNSPDDSRPDLPHSAIYLKFLYYLFLIHHVVKIALRC